MPIFTRSRLQWSDINPEFLKSLITLARNEDLYGSDSLFQKKYSGDITTHLVKNDTLATVVLQARTQGVLCGVQLIPLIFEVYEANNCSFTTHLQDGDTFENKSLIATLVGSSKKILEMERVLLNFLQHLSGISTHTHKFVKKMGSSSTQLLDTRKTTPGYRLLEKYAVACGGAYNHRLGLYDHLLIKDNHLAAESASKGEALTEFLKTAKKQYPEACLEVEIDSIDQIEPALAGNPDILLLDNFIAKSLKILHSASSNIAPSILNLVVMKTNRVLELFFNKNLSPNQKIIRDLWCHHLGVLLLPIFFYFKKGFDIDELLWTICIPIIPFLLLSYLFFRGKVLTEPHYRIPEYKPMRLYFWVMIGSVSFKALMPNILNFPWMLLICFATELFFGAYLLILHWGVQDVNPDVDI